MNWNKYASSQSAAPDKTRAAAILQAEGKSVFYCPRARPFLGGFLAFAGLFGTTYVSGNVHTVASKTACSGSQGTKPFKIDFRIVTISNGKTADGTWTATYEMLGSNGHTVWKTTIPYDSIAHAQRVIQSVVEQASEIIRTSREVDDQGRDSGRRTLLRIPVKSRSGHSFRLIWRSDSSLHEIEGDTLQDVLDLEAYLKTDSKKQP